MFVRTSDPRKLWKPGQKSKFDLYQRGYRSRVTMADVYVSFWFLF